MLVADGLHRSNQRKFQYVTKLCSTFCTIFWVTSNLQNVGYPMKFPMCINGTAMQSHRPCWTGTKWKGRLSWTNHRYGRNLGSLIRRWNWEILEHPPYSSDMSPCDYDLFAKVKEPLRGTRYNTRIELIRGIGRSIQNINKDRRADGVGLRRLPDIRQKFAS